MIKLLPAILSLLCLGASFGLNGLNVDTDNNIDNQLSTDIDAVDKSHHNRLVKEYSRLLVLTEDRNLGPNYVPPTPAELIATVLDPNHQYAISSGFYTPSSAAQLRQDAIDFLRDTYCLDFGGPNATVDPSTGVITLAVPNLPGPPNVYLMFPYTSQNATEISVAFDSAHPERGITGKWYGFQYGEVVASAQNSVLCNGQTFELGDTIPYFQYNLVNSPIPQKTPHTKVEVLTLAGNYISLDVPSSQGYHESLSKLRVTDHCGHVGFSLENILFYRDEITNDVWTRTRVTATWDKR